MMPSSSAPPKVSDPNFRTLYLPHMIVESLYMEALNWITVGSRESPRWISPQSMCIVDRNRPYYEPQSLRSIEEWQSFSPGVSSEAWPSLPVAQTCLLIACVESIPQSFLPMDIYSLKTIPLQRWLLPRLAKPRSLIQLYTTKAASLFSCLQ